MHDCLLPSNVSVPDAFLCILKKLHVSLLNQGLNLPDLNLLNAQNRGSLFHDSIFLSTIHLHIPIWQHSR